MPSKAKNREYNTQRPKEEITGKYLSMETTQKV